MDLKNIIQEAELFEKKARSAAFQQAQKMGLTYAGWGKYKDKSGNVTHKAVGDKLVPVGSDEPAAATPKAEPKPKAVQPEPEPAEEPSVSQKLKKGPKSDVFTEKRLKDFYELGNKINSMKTELEQMTAEYGESTRQMLEEFERLDKKTMETENFLAKMARKQTLRTNVSYQQAFNFLVDKVNQELKEAAQATLKATEKISYVSGKVDVTKKQETGGAEEGFVNQNYGSLEEDQLRQVQQISDSAAGQIKKSNENIDALMMLIKILLAKS